MKQDRSMLAEHGTQLMQLKPGSIVHTAYADLARRARNSERGEALEGGYERYAFHRKHVRRAIDARDLISRALAEIGLGQASSKLDTRLIYADAQLLRAAFEVADPLIGQTHTARLMQ